MNDAVDLALTGFQRFVDLTAGESVPSGLPQEMRAEVNRLLLRATAPDPEQRISMDEMLATAEDWCRRLER